MATFDASTSYDHLSNKRIYKTTKRKPSVKDNKKCPQVKPDWIRTSEKMCTNVWSLQKLMKFFLWWSPNGDLTEQEHSTTKR